MSTAGLAPTSDIQSGIIFQTLFWERLAIGLYGDDVAYDAWVVLAAAGDADDVWFADRYSGYVMMFSYTNTDAGNGSDVLYKGDEDGNGWCIQDARETSMLGGYCLFPY